MTIEELEEKFLKQKLRVHSYGINGEEVYEVIGNEFDIDGIVNHINVLQNRTCKSCKHFELDRFEVNRGTCRNKNTPTRNFMVDCDYGCNRYEAKE